MLLTNSNFIKNACTVHFRKKKIFLQEFLRYFTDRQIQVPHYLFFNSGLDKEDKISLITGIKVIDDFITNEEENSLLLELNSHLKRMRYETGHWDNAIKDFRETEKSEWNPNNFKIIERVKNFVFKNQVVPIKQVHVLDLKETGVILPHIDSIKFCGSTIAGLSLLSDSVMRLVHSKDKKKIVDVLLKRCSLYIMTGDARYNYTHEILGNDNSKFGDKIIKKGRRISVICRNEP